jgi:two-component system chemotaxis response regulator CheB
VNIDAEPPNGRDIVVIGASAGGVEATQRLARGLTPDLDAAVFVVLHVPAAGKSVLPHIIERSGSLPAVHASEGDPIEHGRIYVAPPDHHLEIVPGFVRLSRTPPQNGHRPAIDRLFTSAAEAYGRRVTAVILSGALDDGSLGLSEIVRAGGAALVQEPGEALYPDMPTSASLYVPSAEVMPVDDLARRIVELTKTPPPQRLSPVDLPDRDWGELAGDDQSASSIFTCPECSGPLLEDDRDGILKFRCRVGHVYSAESLAAAQGQGVEEALWTALRALEERAELADRLGRRFAMRGRHVTAARYERRSSDARRQADTLRTALEQFADAAAETA